MTLVDRIARHYCHTDIDKPPESIIYTYLKSAFSQTIYLSADIPFLYVQVGVLLQLFKRRSYDSTW